MAGYPKLTNWLVALVWVSFFAVIISLFIANLTTNYDVTYNTSDIDTYNKLAKLNSSIKEYNEDISTFEEDPDLTDVIGQYFSRGYSVLMIAFGSYDIMSDMVSDALSSEGLSTVAGESLKMAILMTALIFLIVGIIVTVIVKMRV